MITMICGVPGSGKSTALSWIAKRALHPKKRHRPIVLAGTLVAKPHEHVMTNFPFPGAAKLDFNTLGKVDYDDCLILIDEAMMYMDSRDFKNFSEYLKQFFSQHRKMNIDIVLASQSYDDTDKKVRNLTVNLFHCVQLPFFDLFRLTAINPFFDIKMDKIASGYEWGRSQIIWGRPLFKLFDSFAQIKETELEQPLYIEWDLDHPDA